MVLPGCKRQVSAAVVEHLGVSRAKQRRQGDDPFLCVSVTSRAAFENEDFKICFCILSWLLHPLSVPHSNGVCDCGANGDGRPGGFLKRAYLVL